MEAGRKLFGDNFEQPSLKLAIVGGGKVCKSFLELLQHIPPLPEITFEILGVSDPDPDAEGLCFAEKLGIFTTCTFTDLFTIPDLDGFIELTNDENVLLEVTRKRPRGLWVMGHDLARIIIWFIRMHVQSRKREQEVSLVRMVSEFLLQHGNERIVLLSPDFMIQEASEAYLQAVQKIRKEVVGKHCYEITHGFSSPCSEWDSGCNLPHDADLENRRKCACHTRTCNGLGEFHILRPGDLPCSRRPGRTGAGNRDLEGYYR